MTHREDGPCRGSLHAAHWYRRKRDQNCVASVAGSKSMASNATFSTHVLAAIRTMNRLECVSETRPSTVWRLWHQRGYAPRFLPNGTSAMGPGQKSIAFPKKRASARPWPNKLGSMARRRLPAIHSPEAPAWLWEVPAVETLRRVWVQQFAWLQACSAFAPTKILLLPRS
jgi:hypothetical protein